ncbi:DUF3990 domain-containing protein [Clostridium sp.]|uniref:DUF3990 domain-containing protein n=1 Tax=Clostridium sp. TaxID=1506 RepID=UPI0028430A7C|nr:DUF3990 domain-containing protein [Clostridium sp.]MDR3596622.1 DUF3990 domain-containing protein [Clostridium sp.]
MSDIKTIYHGSTDIVKTPKYGYGKENNDYGRSFYCTADRRSGSLWSVNKGEDGYNNRYEIDIDGLKILELNKDDILLWMSILLNNRIPNNLDDDIEFIRKKFIKKYLKIDVKDYDIIIGYRADDSYFQIVESFLSNQLALEVLEDALNLGKLGKQFVLISSTAFERMEYLGSDLCNADELYDDYMLNDKTARFYFRQLLKESFNNGKTFVRDLLGGR